MNRKNQETAANYAWDFAESTLREADKVARKYPHNDRHSVIMAFCATSARVYAAAVIANGQKENFDDAII